MKKLLGLIVLVLGFFGIFINPIVGAIVMAAGALITWSAESTVKIKH